MLQNLSLLDWVIIIITIITVLYWYGTRTYNRFVDACIPYIKPKPFIGNMTPMMFQTMAITDFIKQIYDRLKGYKFGGMFNFENPVFFLRDPELIKLVTVKDFEHFLDHRPFATEDVEPIFGKGLINLKGQRWRDMRSTLSPAFTSSKMKAMFNLMDECGAQAVKFLKKCIKESKLPSDGCKIEKERDILVVEMKDLFTRYANDVIATAAFGISVDSLQNPTNKFYEMGTAITNLAGLSQAIKFIFFFLCPSVLKVLGITFIKENVANFFRNIVHGTIATREGKGIVRPDMIHLLMQAKKGTLVDETNAAANGKKPKQNWDDDDLTAQAVLFFFAGFDTSSALLCFMSYLLALHPEIQTKLQDEIDQTLKNNDGKVTYETLNAMKYLDTVVSESLRLYPPAIFTDRICTKPYMLPTEPPVQIKVGEAVWIPIYAIHRDAEFFPEPDKFDPERFNGENKHNIKPFTFMPFGLGPRNCIGSRFALMESKLVMVHLLSNFNFKAVSKTPIPIKISTSGFNLLVDGGFWLGIEPRDC